ncbi:radical SAM protein [candidate division KSB1 bacterium]|nr:radical SAM protein [candidate division KSB1 bacterium]
MVTFTIKQFKSILNVYKYIDSWFWAKYSVNGYNGCQFGCIYCDSRSAKYHLPADFENDIIVKDQPGAMLDQRLAHARTLRPDVVAMSGANDPYQPAEKKFENTLACAKVLAKHRYPVHICTKSPLVLRDVNVYQQIARDTWCAISVTITTQDTDVARFLEPRAPTPQQRLDTIRSIKQQAPEINSGVLLMPIIPELTDAVAQLDQLVAAAKDVGADYVIFSPGLTMRDVQADWFLKHLMRHYPNLMPRFEQLYKFDHRNPAYHGQYNPTGDYLLRISEQMLDICASHKMPYRIKRFLPRDERRLNYQIAEILLNKAYELQIQGKSWQDMHWAGIHLHEMKQSVDTLYAMGELNSLRNVTPIVEKEIVEVLGRIVKKTVIDEYKIR